MPTINLELKSPGELLDEIARLRDALFKIQCEQLDRATDTARSAKSHREKAMATRDRIIAILSGPEVPNGTRETEAERTKNEAL